MLSLFDDHLGLVSPFILKWGTILQDLCHAKLEWDEVVAK